MKFVVNKRGGVHTVEDDRAKELLGQGYRTATKEEISGWYEAQGLEAPKKKASDKSGDKDGEQSPPTE